MDGKNVCENCSKELEPAASIVFTPHETGAKEKHICINCFEKLGADGAK